jgi:hypothetical protein
MNPNSSRSRTRGWLLVAGVAVVGSGCAARSGSSQPVLLRSQRMCRAADAVLLVEPTSSAGAALVLDVLKDDSATARSGGTISFVEQGRAPSDAPLAPDKRYLVFAQVLNERFIFTPAATFESTPTAVMLGLTGRSEEPIDDDDLHAVPELDVFSRLRHFAASGECATPGASRGAAR